ncbi:hypothetical protein LMED105_16073 [Limnobacter sp. MED105]|nr:hypothetical protein LMED105_16073 [Limnobacter sp. MED105]
MLISIQIIKLIAFVNVLKPPQNCVETTTINVLKPPQKCVETTTIDGWRRLLVAGLGVP